MAKISDYFERILVVNRLSAGDRRERLCKHLQDTGLAEPSELHWVKAIAGDWCQPPDYFKAGNGAWCRLSTPTYPGSWASRNPGW